MATRNPKRFSSKFFAPVQERIPPLDLQWAKRLSIAVGTMGNASMILLAGAFMTGFIKEMGASDKQVGWLAAMITLGQLAQIPSSLLLERLRRRKYYFTVTAFLHRFCWTVVVLLPLWWAVPLGPDAVWVVIGVMLVSMLLAQTSSPAWISWMGDLIPESERGTFFGQRQGAIQAVSLIVILGSGLFMDRFQKPSEGGTYLGYMYLFGFATLIGCLDIILHMAVPEPPMVKAEKGPSRLALILRPLRDKNFIRFSLILGFFSFGAQVVNPFGVVYCLDDLNLSWSFLVSFLGAVNLPFAVLGSLVWGWMAQRYGHKPVLIVTSMLGLANLLLWFTVSTTPVTIAAPGLGTVHLKMHHLVLPVMNMIGGFVWSGHALATFNLLLGLSPSQGRPIYLATFSTLVGILASLGPVLGGSLAHLAKAHQFSYPFYFGVTLNYWHILLSVTTVVWLILTGLMFSIQRPQESPVGFFIVQITKGNPLRAFFQMVNVHFSFRPGRRARAVRSLGDSKSSLAVPSLVKQLDDPDRTVREEAALSLGRIGDPAAVASLVERLRDPDGDLRIASARSLGLIGGQEAVCALLEQMGDSSREVRLEAVRSLGTLAPPAAQDPLLRLLTVESDGQIRAAACTALGRLRNIESIWEMIELIRLSRSPLVRAETAIAIGQLLGAKQRFYPIYLKERDLPGSQVSRLLAQIQSRLGLVRNTSQHKETTDSIARIREAYVDRDYPGCAQLLEEFVRDYACLAHGFTRQTPDLVFYLLSRDWRLAACLYYEESLVQLDRASYVPPGEAEVLLGIYFFRRILDPPSFDYEENENSRITKRPD